MLHYFSAVKFARALASTAGLGLVLHDKDGAWTDGKNMYLPRPRMDYTKEDEIAWKAYLYHEIGHNTAPYDDWLKSVKKNKIDCSSSFGRACNIVDDFRQEYLLSGRYPGRDKTLSEGRAIITRKGELSAQDMIAKHGHPTDPTAAILHALHAVSNDQRCGWQRDMVSVLPLCESNLSEPAKEVRDNLVSKGMDKELFDLKTHEEVIKYVKRVFEESGQDPEQANQDGKPEADGGASDLLKELMDALEMHLHHVEQTKGKSAKECDGSPSGKPGDESGVDGEYELTDPYVVSWKDYDGCWPSSVEVLQESALASHLRKVLQVRSQSGYEYGHKSGKLAARNLYRVATDQDTLYRRRDIRPVLDCAVSLLVDISGSMATPDKFPNAAAAASLMSRTLDLCAVKNEIIEFTDNEHGKGSVRVLLKGFDERPAQSDLCKRFEKCSPGSNNLDGEAILFAYERLVARPEQRKILLVLSDGFPSGSPKDGSGNVKLFTKQVIQTVKKEIEIYGIGFMTRAVEQYYPEYSIVDTAEEIAPALLKIISTKLI